MRLLRIGVLILFVLCLGLNIWTSAQYDATHDTEGPTITVEGETLELSVTDGPEALMQGLTASDKLDGDLTGRILLAGKSFFLEPGVFNAEYVVFDSHQNSHTVSRRVRYTDYVGPEFSLAAPLVFTRGDNIRYMDYIRAYDVLDGDITDQIQEIASNVSKYTSGTYPVLLEVSNSFGDTIQVELMVQVLDIDDNGAKVTLSDYLVYLQVGEEFDPYELISSVYTHDGMRLSKTNVQVLGTVDTQTPGCYQLVFSCSHGGFESETYLAVVVREEVA